METAETGFKYEVAFSFTGEDEGLATQINDLLRDRYRTFLYSREQKKLAGTDGEETFNDVFGKEARTVAVLLRPEWGSSAWTRIEQIAIKNRAYDQGYDFTTFIVTAPGTPIPSWVPKTRLWYNLERFGLDGAAAVLSARIQARGGDTAEETLAAQAERLQRAQKFNQEKEAFARSQDGVNASRAAHKRLVDDINASTEVLKSVGSRIQNVPYGNVIMIVGNVVMTVRYELHYANSLDKSALTAEFYDGIPHLPGIPAFSEEPRTLERWKFTFELVGPGRSAWVGPNRKEHPPDQMKDFLLGHFLDLQHRARR
jgi:hypothetical protein